MAGSPKSIGIPTSSSYEDAVWKLGTTLQSNPDVLARTRMSGKKKGPKKVKNMEAFIIRSGHSLDDVDKLSVIHIGGTKGKGSTCAYCESICRSHGYKTGLFTSPHMDEVRERIRINGKPLSKEKFTEYFWMVYCKLKATEEEPSHALGETGGMPAYFAFMVILSLHVFISEGVDVAIYEVGIGGEYDNTNFFRKPAACGIASLGLDHCSVLGNTIAQIAWHKAGIFKKGCPAVTTIQEVPDYQTLPKNLKLGGNKVTSPLSFLGSVLYKIAAFLTSMARYILPGRFFAAMPKVEDPMEVILQRSSERQCPLYIAPPLSEEVLRKYNFTLGIAGHKQVRNASLAVQLVRMWEQSLQRGHTVTSGDGSETIRSSSVDAIPRLETTELDEQTIDGLKNCYWPGRTQIIKRDKITYYLDGAHTQDSIRVCASWFKDVADAELTSLGCKVSRVLMYNITGNRNPAPLLQELVNCQFDAAVFCPNLTSTMDSGNKADHFDKRLTDTVKRNIPLENKTAWDTLILSSHSNSSTLTSDRTLETHSHVRPTEEWSAGRSIPPSYAFPCILQALAWATQDKDPLVKVKDPTAVIPEVPFHLCEAEHIQVLITGSLVLVGDSLGVLCPDMNDDDNK